MQQPLLKILPWVLLCALLGFLALNAPLRGGLTIGGDDGFELCKAQLLERHPDMAVLLHNDQPWLHTLLIAKAFALFGENAAIPRLFSLLMMGFVVVGVWHLFGKTNVLESALFVIVLFSSKEIPILSTSAMLEPTGMGLAVLAVTCSYNRSKVNSSWRCYGAGALIAAAVACKLTALLICPAWAVLLYQQRSTVPLVATVLKIAAGFMVGICVALALFPEASYEALWQSHLNASRAINLAKQPQYGFQSQDVFNDWTILLSVTLGVLAFCLKPSARPYVLFGVVWLLTDLAVLIPHKPWWGYYAIHFHIPLALLSATGAGWVIRCAWMALVAPGENPPRIGRFVMSVPTFSNLCAIFSAIIVACFCGIRFPEFWKETADIHTRELDKENAFIPTIRHYSPKAHWIYCSENSVAFHGGVLQPPELVIMTYKRLVTHDITKDVIYNTIVKYGPELVILRREGEAKERRFQSFLADKRYVKVMSSGISDLWVAPELSPTEMQESSDLIRKLRL